MLFRFLGSRFPTVVAEGTSVLSTGAAHRRVQRRETEMHRASLLLLEERPEDFSLLSHQRLVRTTSRRVFS